MPVPDLRLLNIFFIANYFLYQFLQGNDIESVSMDFITDLPMSDGVDSILVVVDHLSKMAHFLSCSKDITADQTASLFLKHVVCLHSLPDDIVSDHGP